MRLFPCMQKSPGDPLFQRAQDVPHVTHDGTHPYVELAVGGHHDLYRVWALRHVGPSHAIVVARVLTSKRLTEPLALSVNETLDGPTHPRTLIAQELESELVEFLLRQQG